MITNFNISNFKLHNHTELQFNGLTILTGINGMGKSSVIQSLLLLRQSFMMNDLDEGLNLKGDLFDAGTSGEIACQSSTEQSMKLNLKFDAQNDLNYIFDYPEDVLATLLPGISKNEISKETLSRYSLFNKNFQYLSAFRFGPRNSYERNTSLVVNRNQISKEQGRCEYAIHYLEHYKKKEIPIKELAISYENDSTLELQLLDQVGMWMQRIAPNVRIGIEPIGEDLKLRYKFRRQGNTITDEMSAINIGFGITYVLPILVAILSAEKDAIIFIENPEAHIHPAGQAVLMELISKAVASGVQIVIETHSDHIVNGCLVSVKQGFITPEMLSIYYFERDESVHTAQPHYLEVSPTGRIKCPPKGFFDQINIDLRKLLGLDYAKK